MIILIICLVIKHSKRVEPIRQHSLASLVNIHASAGRALRIDGKVYENVQGYTPYYLVITNLDSIFFVTEQPNGFVTYHIYNLKNRKDAIFLDQIVDLGDFINSSAKDEQIFIEKATPDNFIIVEKIGSWKVTCDLNLKLMKVEVHQAKLIE